MRCKLQAVKADGLGDHAGGVDCLLCGRILDCYALAVLSAADPVQLVKIVEGEEGAIERDRPAAETIRVRTRAHKLVAQLHEGDDWFPNGRRVARCQQVDVGKLWAEPPNHVHILLCNKAVAPLVPCAVLGLVGDAQIHDHILPTVDANVGNVQVGGRA